MQNDLPVPVPPKRNPLMSVLKFFLVLLILELILFLLAAWTGDLWPEGTGSNTLLGNFYYGNKTRYVADSAFFVFIVLIIIGLVKLKHYTKSSFIWLSIISFLLSLVTFIFKIGQLWTIIPLIVFILLLFQRKNFIN